MASPKREEDSYLCSPLASSDSDIDEDLNDSTDVAISSSTCRNEVLTQSTFVADSPYRTIISEDELLPNGPIKNATGEDGVDLGETFAGMKGHCHTRIQSKEKTEDLVKNSDSSIRSDECPIMGKIQCQSSIVAIDQSSNHGSQPLEVSCDEEAEPSHINITTDEAYVYVNVICEMLQKNPVERVLLFLSKDSWDCEISKVNLHRKIMEQNCGKVPKNRPGSSMKTYFDLHCQCLVVMYVEQIKSKFGDKVADEFQQLVEAYTRETRGAHASSRRLSQTFLISSSSSNVENSQNTQEDCDADGEFPVTPSKKRRIDECEGRAYLRAICKLLETEDVYQVFPIVRREDWSQTYSGVNLRNLILQYTDVPENRSGPSMKCYFKRNTKGNPNFLAMHKTQLEEEFGPEVVEKLNCVMEMYKKETRTPKKSYVSDGQNRKITPTKLFGDKTSLAEVEEKLSWPGNRTNNPASPGARSDGNEVVVIE